MELGPKHEARSLVAESKAGLRDGVVDLSAAVCSSKIHDDLQQRSIDTKTQLRRKFLAEDPPVLAVSVFWMSAQAMAGGCGLRSRKQQIAFKSSTRIGQKLCNMLIFKDNMMKIVSEGPNQSYLFWLSDARNMHKILGIRGVSQNQICNFAGDEPQVHLLSCFH